MACLRARGLHVDERSLASCAGSAALVLAQVLERVPTLKEAAELSEVVAAHAATGRPPVLYLPLEGRKAQADESATCRAFLRAHGAVVCSDPEVFVECLILLAAYGPPTGSRVAIIAPPSTWLEAAAAAQARRAESLGLRATPSSTAVDGSSSIDILLTDCESYAGQRSTKILVVPVSGRPAMSADRPTLVGLASALAAAEITGRAAQRIAAGIGPAASPMRAKDVDHTRFTRQLDKLGERVGDHECKVLLSSYGVAITRQAVATTPSAATRIAKKAGFPVEMKAWGEQIASEPEGCLVLGDIQSAADVRRAFSSICASSNAEATIIRETPMRGRELRLSFRRQGALGLVVLLHQEGHAQPAAALCPLQPVDALSLASQVVASRAADEAPDASALADLMRRASHVIADNERVLALELPRVIVGRSGEGAVVVDARATLRAR